MNKIHNIITFLFWSFLTLSVAIHLPRVGSGEEVQIYYLAILAGLLVVIVNITYINIKGWSNKFSNIVPLLLYLGLIIFTFIWLSPYISGQYNIISIRKSLSDLICFIGIAYIVNFIAYLCQSLYAIIRQKRPLISICRGKVSSFVTTHFNKQPRSPCLIHIIITSLIWMIACFVFLAMREHSQGGFAILIISVLITILCIILNAIYLLFIGFNRNIRENITLALKIIIILGVANFVESGLYISYSFILTVFIWICAIYSGNFIAHKAQQFFNKRKLNA